MSIKSTDLSYIAVQIAETVYSRIAVDSPSYSNPKITDTYMAQSEITELLLEFNPKNQIIREIATVVDVFGWELQKGFSEDLATSDALRTVITKNAAQDILNILEQHSIELIKPLTDSTDALDFIQLLLTKEFSEQLFASDEYVKHFTKRQHEVLLAQDDFYRVAEFTRHFKDFIAIDDISQIDKFYDSAKHNVIGTVDESAWDFIKGAKDTVNSYDLASWVFDKNLNDVIGLPDVLAKDIQVQLPVDLTTVTDDALVTLQKNFNDSFVFTDAQTFISELGKYDEAAVQDLLQLVAQKVLTDSADCIDSIRLNMDLTIQPDLISVEDVYAINTSTAFNEYTAVADYSIIDVVKYITDSVSTSDSLEFDVSTHLYDAVAMDDVTGVDKEHFTTKHNVAFTSDHMARGLVKPLIDSVSINSYPKLQLIKELEDLSFVTDYFEIDIIRGGSSMFNASLFNQSTFG